MIETLQNSCNSECLINDDSDLSPVISIPFRKGTTIRKDYPYLSTADDGKTFSVIDLTGYAGSMLIKPDINSDTVLLTLNTENGGMQIYQSLFTDNSGVEYPDAWTVEFVISDSVTAAIDWIEAVGNIQLISPNNDVIDFLTVILKPV